MVFVEENKFKFGGILLTEIVSELCEDRDIDNRINW
jgi:hypothetical protein